jgi:hypothetical protein
MGVKSRFSTLWRQFLGNATKVLKTLRLATKDEKVLGKLSALEQWCNDRSAENLHSPPCFVSDSNWLTRAS